MTTESQSFQDELIGRVIAEKFCIKQCVGLGASGAVFRAEQLTLGRTVAIKVLKPELAAQPRIVQRFHDEALATSRLNHPNTVAVIDYGQTLDGLLYIVMEFLRGRTLTEVMDGQGPLPEARITEIVNQVLRGLEEAHQAGVVHADLKADNIMVERRRDEDLVKVVDFGIARLVGEADRERDGEEKTICGTPEYMAPEVISGEKPTFASDIYAVGIILYELLCEKTPFAGSPTMEILARHLREAPKPPGQLNPRATSPVLEQATLRALSKAPDARFRSASAFRDFLRPRIESAVALDITMICAGCGVESVASFKFCPECGCARESSAESSAKAGKISHRPTIEVEAEHDDFSQGGSTRVGRAPSRQLGALPLPLVGRFRHRDAVFDFVTGASSRNVLQLVGEQGIGRSRLLKKVAEQATLVGAITYLVDADPTGLATPLYPLQSMIAAILGVPADVNTEELSAAVTDFGLNARDVPGLADLFGLPTDIAELDQTVRRREILASTVRLLKTAAEKHQAVLVFENVEDYDQPTQELLRKLAEREGDVELRIVVSNSLEYAKRWPDRVVRIELDPLDDVALHQVATHLAGHSSHSMPSADKLHELCRGNPGHIEQLVRFILEGGAIDGAPSSVVDLVTARAEHLPHLASLVAQVIAIFGNQVSLPLLTAASHDILSANELDETLSVLVGRGIVETDEYSAWFATPLVRNVVYDSTPADVRRALHEIAVATLVPANPSNLLLGHHQELAGNFNAAASLLSAAGDEAMDMLDEAGASKLYERALSSARHRLMRQPGDESETLYVSVAIKFSDSLRRRGELNLAKGILDEARRYCHEAPELGVQLERAAARLASAEDDLAGAILHLRQGIEQGAAAHQRETTVDLFLDLASLLLRSESADAALRELEKGLDTLTYGEGYAAENGPTNLWNLLYRVGKLHASIGSTEKALTYGEAALRHARRIGKKSAVAKVCSLLVRQYRLIENHKKADSYQQEAVTLMRALGDRRGTAELLIANLQPTRELSRIDPDRLREARSLAREIDWAEGVNKLDSLGTA